MYEFKTISKVAWCYSEFEVYLNILVDEYFKIGYNVDKKDNIYYVVTAKHVVDKEYYESLLDSKIEYISDTTDLAILSFEYDGDLTVLDFESEKISKNDKIMVIGHPEGKRYKITYGYIKSGLKDFRGDKVIEHDAYMKQGNSGGVALTKNMKIAGINIAGTFTLSGHYRFGYMIPYDIVKKNIETWRNQ